MSGPKPTTTTCRSYVPTSELPAPVQVAVAVAVGLAVAGSGNEVDKATGPYDAEVCTAPDGTATYKFHHSTTDENWFSPNIWTIYTQTLGCDDNGHCTSEVAGQRWRETSSCNGGLYQKTGWERNTILRFGTIPKK